MRGRNNAIWQALVNLYEHHRLSAVSCLLRTQRSSGIEVAATGTGRQNHSVLRQFGCRQIYSAERPASGYRSHKQPRFPTRMIRVCTPPPSAKCSNCPSGGYIIDTPGIKGFGTFDMEKEEVAHYFKRNIRRYRPTASTTTVRTHTSRVAPCSGR